MTLDAGISVRYIYSACIVTSSKDVRVLHDPWFTEGIYDGSWFHFPTVADPIASIGDVDLIYISHVHPDHYDPIFLRKYFEVHGSKEVIIADHKPNYLANKMRADGFKPTILKPSIDIGSSRITIVPHRTGSISDIDSALIFRYFDGKREHCVVNGNDVIFDDEMIAALKESAYEPDILLCGYTGAGPYPQTYFDIDDPQLPIEAEKKKHAFFQRYLKLVSGLHPKVTIPFAGKYILGGKLARLNRFRGVADATEVLAIDRAAVVLQDNGGQISTFNLEPTAVRVRPYSEEDMELRQREISLHKFDYERLISESEIYQLPLKRLLSAAARRASERSECLQDYYFVFELPGGGFASVNAKHGGEEPVQFCEQVDVQRLEPRSEINIDPRYLFGLLTGVYHWNNAEIGSQFETRRYPNQLNRKAESFLNFFAI
ncbi:MAG: MBL fold metallo-hydrolase [Candidatus Sulfotelmatobacter sp.]